MRDGLPATISYEVALRLLAAEAALPLSAELRYDAADPYAVEALFDTGAESLVLVGDFNATPRPVGLRP